MSAIVPPLDIIPKLPAKAVTLVIKQIDTQTDRLLDTVTKTVQDTVKLPVNIKCDDPRITQIKKQLADIQKQITTVQETIPKIQTTINTVRQLIGVAAGIKTALSVAQLANPVTAPLFIAQQLTAIQDATIVNAISSLSQFSSVPATLTSKLQTITTPLLGAIAKVSNVCNGDVETLTISQDALSNDALTNIGLQTGTDYNDLVDTKFYNEENVSDDDLQHRSDTIQQLLEQQQNLLTSLQEAPSKVYQASGAPSNTLGKLGDYYINLDNQSIYGPKLRADDWGQPVN
jgi:DNA repair exonuclease SbcCD ATPase subunit